MLHKKNIYLGAHMSASGGLENALYAAEKINANAVQLFTKSNQQWAAKKITSEQIALFKEAISKTGIHEIVSHACYLINLCSPDIETRNKSKNALLIELERCHSLDIPYLVVHPGACKELPREEGLAAVAESINEVMESFHGTTQLLIENMAGQGSTVGKSIQELSTIYTTIKDKKRVHFCIDTCHAFASGYKLDEKKAYKEFFEEFDSLIGLEHIKAFHMNNSLKECGSHVDRHAPLYEGQIKSPCFEMIVNDERFIAAPKILETPKGDGPEEDEKNIAYLVDLIDDQNREKIENSRLSIYLKRKATY
jgi:deoxyribonuclease-4